MLSICSQLVTLYRTKVYSSTNISLYNKCATVLFEHTVYIAIETREKHISAVEHTHTHNDPGHSNMLRRGKQKHCLRDLWTMNIVAYIVYSYRAGLDPEIPLVDETVH